MKTKHLKQSTINQQFYYKDYLILYITAFLCPPYALYKIVKSKEKLDTTVKAIWTFIIIIYSLILIKNYFK